MSKRIFHKTALGEYFPFPKIRIHPSFQLWCQPFNQAINQQSAIIIVDSSPFVWQYFTETHRDQNFIRRKMTAIRTITQAGWGV